MKDCILHNPRCAKSRQTLALLQKKGVEPTIIQYLKEPPSTTELRDICNMLGAHPTDIIRRKESVFSELGLSLDDDRSEEEWIALMIANPKLIERPIVVLGGRAVVGRPPENVLEIL